MDLSLNYGNNLTLNLSCNYLIFLSTTFIKSVELENEKCFITLLLFNNTFSCNCDTIIFVRWFQTTSVAVGEKETVSCSYRGGGDIKISYVKVFELKLECSVEVLFNTEFIVLLIIWALLFVTSTFLEFRFYFHGCWYKIKRKQKGVLRNEKSMLVT